MGEKNLSARGFGVSRSLALALAFSLGSVSPAAAEWARTRINVHAGPSPSATAPVVATLERGDEVDVLEERRGWGRISPFKHPSSEGQKGRKKVARWIQLRNLTNEKPTPLPQSACEHPNIDPEALPKKGLGGISEEEAELLCRGALHYLESGQCERVEYGDKSLSRPGYFFVNCGGDNLFFREEDLPDAASP